MSLRPSLAARIAFAAISTVALLAASPAAALDFFTVTPCRVYGPGGPLDMGLTFSAQKPGTNGIPVTEPVVDCEVPADAVAVAFNVTIVGATDSGELVVFPAGQMAPTVGALVFSAGRTRSMLEIVQLGTGGAFTGRVDALATATSPGSPGTDQYHLILDVTGYFTSSAPEVTTTAGTTAFTEDGGAVVVDAGVTVTDPDDTNLQSATVSLASAPDGAAETLAVNSPVTNCPGLTVTPGNPLTITGSQLLATYETCLQSVTYDNTDQDPDTTDRTVNFVVNDGTNNSNTATKTVSVAGVNDAPTITSSATPSVPENQTTAIDVQSTDAEDSEGAGLTYSITGGADAALFSIDAGTGVLSFNSAPDFENPQDAGANNVYDVQVTVTDSGPGPLTDVQDLQVTVTAANEVPTITSSATPSVAENQTAVIDVQSTDAEDSEGAGLTYSITGGADAALFSIVPATGVLSFNSAPDFENPQDAGADNVYDVQVTVTDSSSLTDVQNLQVTVTDGNDAPTITSSATPSAAENQTAVIDVQSTDPEGDTEGSGLTYSITGGADAALFSIVPATGVLSFNSAPDFENPQDAGANNVYDVQVTVTDSSSLTDVQNLQVTVTDGNDAPTITSSATPSAAENQTAVIDVQSTDPDGETEGAGLTYSLTGGADQALFSIVPATGVLTFNSAPDFENPQDAGANNVYDVQVTVTDAGTLTDVQNLQVTVTDVPEAPSITSSATPSVAENQTAVIDVQSTDPDGDTEGAGLTYSITGGADAALFSIVPATGVLTFNSAPNFEAPTDAGANNVYDVQVTVTDSGAQTDVQNLQVTVTDVPEAPSITSSATPSAPENQTSVIDVQSTDPEGDTEGAGLTYSITGGADAALFSIVPATGVLTFNSAPNFEAPADAGANNVYDVQVTVTDSGAQTGLQNLQVMVTNVNEAPSITSSATPSAPENQTAVINVQSTDPDGETEGAGLTYSITGGADAAKFSIVAATGVLTFNIAPNFETPTDAGANNVYDVQVTVTDSGAPNLTDVQNLQVTVTDVPEAPIAGDDAYATIGNTLLEVDPTPGAAEPKVVVNGHLLQNDVDQDAGATLSASLASATPGASVTVNADGSFTYVPPPGATSDSFTYTVTDNTALTDIGTVTITINKMVWYVDNTANGGTVHTGTGTSANPFSTLSDGAGDAAANDAEDASSAGHIIYVFEGSGTTNQNQGITLKNQQKLHGEGVDLKVDPDDGGVLPELTLFTASGNEPQLTNTTGNAVTVLANTANGNRIDIEIVGLSLSSTGPGANAVDVTSANAANLGVTIRDNFVTGAPAEGIEVTQNSTGAATLAVNDNTMQATGTALDIARTLGTLTITAFHDNVVTGDSAGAGISVNTALFDAVLGGGVNAVPGGTTVIGNAGNRIGGAGLVLTSVTGALNFANTASGSIGAGDLDIYTDSGPALSMGGGIGGFEFDVTANAGVLVANAGAAAVIASADVGLQLNSLTSNNSPGDGVSLTTVTGTFSAPSGSAITNAGGTDFFISGGSATVTYGGTITDDLGSLVSIGSTTGGAKSFSGAITDGDDGDGGGVSITNNSNSPISFTGGLTLSTGGNPAFAATTNNVGALASLVVTGSTNKITTTTAQALNVTNTLIGSTGLNFRSISAGTGAGSSGVGITLDNTGTGGSNAGLTVSGNSAAGTGGTIQHKTGADGSTTGGIGIYLNNTKNPSFNWMQMNDFDNFAIRGFSVQGFTLDNSVINGVNGNNDGADEAVIRFDNLTVSGLIEDSTIQGGVETNIRVINNTGTLNALVIQNSTIRSNSTTTGGDGIFARAQTGATMTVKVLNCIMNAHRDDHIQTDAENSGVLTTVITGNTLTSNGTVGAPPQASTLGGQITVSGGAAFSSTSTFNISNNIITGAVPAPITVGVSSTTSTASGLLSGTISGNQLGQAGSANSGSSTSDGLSVIVNGASTINATITNNQIRQFNNIGMQFIKRDGSGSMNLTVTGNTVAEPVSPNALQGILVTSGATSGPPADSGTVCADIGGAGALVNTVTGPNFGGDLIRVRQRFSTFVRLPGYGGGATDTTAVANYLIGRNTITNEGLNAKASATTQAPGSFITPGGAACTAGSAPL